MEQQILGKMLSLLWNSCESASRETLPKVLIPWRTANSRDKIRERGTYLQEARPPMDKDIPKDSPTVFEKAIKNPTPQGWGRRGTSAAGRGAGSPQMQEKRDLPPAPSCSCPALHCRWRAVQQGSLSADPPANSVMSGGVSIKIHPLLLMSTCLFFPLMKLEIQADTLFHLPEPAGFICLFNSPVDSKLGWGIMVIVDRATLLIEEFQHNHAAGKGRSKEKLIFWSNSTPPLPELQEKLILYA